MDNVLAAVDVPQVTFKKRNAKSKSTIRKRAATPPPESDSDSGFTSSDDEEGRAVKRRRKNLGVTAFSSNNPKCRVAAAEETTGAARVALTNKDDATKREDWYDEENGKKEKATSKLQDTITSDGTYKGTANYQSFIQKNPDRLGKQVGPLKQSGNVRTITVTDFAPDVCKDYKQTGFCGFGDNCKFLHAREDYKQGWQLDRDWEINTKGKKLTGKTVASANRDQTQEDEDDEALLESIPFACIICKKPYTNPIITKCGHYFCEACALKRYRKDPSCAACGTGTGGVFNVAKKLNRLLDRKREREKQKKEKAGEDIDE
nr:RNA-splicing factor [Exophiala xenobiotica]